MGITLQVIDGPEQGRTFRFDEADSFLVGRSPKAHLQLDPTADPYISRTHCLLELRPPRCFINDLGSTNGTRLNNRPTSSAEVGNGDVIRVGRTAIRVVIDERKDPSEPAERCMVCGGTIAALADPSQQQHGVCTQCRDTSNRRDTLAKPSASTSAAFPHEGSEEEGFRCASCGVDVSEPAELDYLDRHGLQAHYLCASCVHRETDPAIGEKRIGDYRILKEIGRGGMGVVYRSVHKASGRLCAIKQLLTSIAKDETARRRFEREIDVQAEVEHPHLVRVWDRARDEDEVLYFVTEYMAGGDMERLATKVVGGPLAPPLATRLICQVLKGLHELHLRGMIHRDLKPANFLLTHPATDPRCVAKISDYGLAKCFEDAGNSLFAYTNAGHVAGSMLFMAPEQITNFRFVRPPSDVYSVGVSLYYLLTATYTMDLLPPERPGQPEKPGQGRTRHPVEMIVEDPPVPILERKSSLPAELASVLDRAVQKNQADRFQSAEEFRTVLEDTGATLGWW
jgi:serine/threonine-protein kinase